MSTYISSTTTLGWALLALVLSSSLAQIVRKRLSHPLRSFPGPWLNSISDIPAAWALVRGNQHAYYKCLHEKYGDVVRVAPEELSFIGPSAWEDIYGVRKGGLNMEKSPVFIGAVAPVAGQTGISLAKYGEHTRQRRAMSAPFTNTALLQIEGILQSHVAKLISAVKKLSSEDRPVDFSSYFTYTTFDIMGDLCFAEPFGCLDTGSQTDWSVSVIKVFISATYAQAIRRVAGVNSWPQRMLEKLLVPADAAKWRKIHFSNSREKTLNRLADGDRDHKDFIYHILRNSESKKALTETEIILNMVLLISAGSETTATLLTGFTYFVCTHRNIYNRLVAEIRSRFTTDQDIKWETVKELPYLEATISEALRMFSPAAGSQQRVVPEGGATIDGHFVPAGITVAVAPWAAARSPLNFLEPHKFIPERWLGDEKFAGDKLDASMPFSTGPKGCIGKNLAYFEMRLILCHLLWNFDMELDKAPSGEESKWGLDGNMNEMKVYQTFFKPELWVRLKEVQR